ncbi:MAG: oligoribonuclease, partial [Methylococcales bacterium]|nr:oligoribonuclease [Methylococcales bacterium]
MTKNAHHLIWIDLEMTGLNPDVDVIIEIATIVTDKELTILAQGPVLAIHQSDDILAAMDDWNQEHHGKSGLIERVRHSTVSTQDAEKATVDFLSQWLDVG